jgi:hypothetical protein
MIAGKRKLLFDFDKSKGQIKSLLKSPPVSEFILDPVLDGTMIQTHLFIMIWTQMQKAKIFSNHDLLQVILI